MSECRVWLSRDLAGQRLKSQGWRESLRSSPLRCEFATSSSPWQVMSSRLLWTRIMTEPWRRDGRRSGTVNSCRFDEARWRRDGWAAQGNAGPRALSGCAGSPSPWLGSASSRSAWPSSSSLSLAPASSSFLSVWRSWHASSSGPKGCSTGRLLPSGAHGQACAACSAGDPRSQRPSCHCEGSSPQLRVGAGLRRQNNSARSRSSSAARPRERPSRSCSIKASATGGSGISGSNRRHSAWEADTLPTQLIPHGHRHMACLAAAVKCALRTRTGQR